MGQERDGRVHGSGAGGPERGLRRAPISGDVVNRQRRPRAGDDEEFDEGPSPEDLERFGGVTRACPACGKELYVEASKCHHCGHDLSAREEGSAGGTTPLWVLVSAVVLIAGFIMVYALRGP